MIKSNMNESQIVNDVYDNLEKDDLKALISCEKHELMQLHHYAGRQIRNVYGLWSTNPLTERWRNNPQSHDIQDGIDCSPDHPDAVSMRIIEALWKKAVRDEALKNSV